MTQTTKAVLLSGLVLPGLGQIFQKHYVRGVLFVGLVFAALGAIVVKALGLSRGITNELNRSNAPMDFGAVAETAIRIVKEQGASTYVFAFLAIVIVWLIAIIDAYLAGRKLEGAARPVNSNVEHHRHEAP